MKRMEVMGKNKKSTVNQNTNDLTVYKVGAAFALLVLALFVAYIIENIHTAKLESQNGEHENETVDKSRKTLWKNIGTFVLGAVCLVVGSRLLVDNGTELAKLLERPEGEVLSTLEQERTEIAAKLRQEYPEVSQQLAEHRQALAHYLRLRYPETSRHLEEVRERFRREQHT